MSLSSRNYHFQVYSSKATLCKRRVLSGWVGKGESDALVTGGNKGEAGGTRWTQSRGVEMKGNELFTLSLNSPHKIPSSQPYAAFDIVVERTRGK